MIGLTGISDEAGVLLADAWCSIQYAIGRVRVMVDKFRNFSARWKVTTFLIVSKPYWQSVAIDKKNDPGVLSQDRFFFF
ncbi:MAG: hypothetical protein LZF61_11285 [Nitrosomonas sp.]|nr:MAG: hypothetical protein LZF61_11285 [Nitrosomonas sp.]